jgi:hypothetical protein
MIAPNFGTIATHLENVYYLASDNSDKNIIGTQRRIIAIMVKTNFRPSSVAEPENISFGSSSAEQSRKSECQCRGGRAAEDTPDQRGVSL